MWLIRTALRRPYTFVVMAMVIALGGYLSMRRAPTDIFPNIDIPVISVIFNYGGLPPEEMEKRVTNNFERFVTTIVADTDHVESQTLTGSSVVKIYMQPDANIAQAIAQITAVAQSAVRAMPPGAVPPLIMPYSATSVPIMQIALESDELSEQQLFDYCIYFVRAEIATIPGVQIPYPYGGKQRQIMIDIEPAKLHGYQLSPRDIQTALAAQNVVLPSGTAKLGGNEYPIIVQASPETLEEIAALPIKTVDNRTIYIRDVANVRDGNSPQTNLVHVGSHRSVVMSILKNGDASTLEITERIKEALPRALERLPAEGRGKLHVKTLFDQSVFVRASIDGVVHEALIAGALTALMILLFLGSLRSTLTVVISIPLSILFSIAMMHLIFGYSMNVMTLGGLALAVGVLVDDATVAIENIHRNIGQRKPFVRAIVDGAQQIALPALVSTLCICIVFLPIVALSGAAKSLFVPMAWAVVFAMLMSYVLSRTLVPTMVHFLLAREAVHHGAPNRFAAMFDRVFSTFRHGYGRWLAWALQHRAFVVTGFLAFVAASFVLMLPIVGRDFFPSVDAGLIKLHVRGAPGMRLEEAEKRILAIEASIHEVVPDNEIETMLDVMGTPYSGINLSLSEGALISPADAQILIALKPGHPPTAEYIRAIRAKLGREYPDSTFFFLAPDISTQVLNFGLAAPIDVQVIGPVGSEDKTLAYTELLAKKISAVPGAVDVHLGQVSNVPQIRISVDRTQAQQAGLSERDVASDLLVSLASSGQVAPTYWLDRRGVQYPIAVQTPQYAIDSMDALRNTPISIPGQAPQTLGNLATIKRGFGPANITHYNIARTFDVQLNIDATDLGTVTDGVRDVLARYPAPPGTRVVLKGQAESMDSSFDGLSSGLVFAILLVYLLLVVFFQSWLDPFLILMALPGALAGIIWILFLSSTTLSVPALIGAIMCVGVATANSVLVVSFANSLRRNGGSNSDARAAALAAGMTRLRPVLMTALAMVIGMVPMAIGLGEGGEQNAPLGRAVIGGLTLATITTLFFVPVMYSLLRRKPPKPMLELDV